MTKFSEKLRDKGLSPKTVEVYTKVLNQVGRKDPITWLKKKG